MNLDSAIEWLWTVWRKDHRGQGLPTLDGAMRPNRRLDAATILLDALPEIEDLCCTPDRAVLFSAGACVYRIDPASPESKTVVAEALGAIGPIAPIGDSIYAGIRGVGVYRFRDGQRVGELCEVDGIPLKCPTAIAVLPDGRIAIAEGSTQNLPQDWARDLLECRCSGRIVVADADLNSGHTVLADLAWPAGLLSRDTNELWFSESWKHRVRTLSLPAGRVAAAPPTSLVSDLPGYPGRLSIDHRGGAWLAVFALRTQLVELVLRDDAYRNDMLATVDPRWWVAPSLGTTGHYLEPLQGGAIKKLGTVKPWAPPRSYGLALRLSQQGRIEESLHSRVGGQHHGITGLLQVGSTLLLCAKGSHRLIGADVEEQA